MDYLQIHDDRELSVWEYKCIIRLRSLLTKNDTYEFIKLPYYPELFGEHGVTVESDIIRFKWLSEHPNGVYIDTDCYLNEPFNPPKNGLPCFPMAPMEPRTFMDIFYIICNGSPNSFKQKAFTREGRNEYINKYVEPKMRSLFYGWPGSLTRQITKFNIISDSHYIHNYSTLIPELKRRLYVTEN